jgi:hypothetical protein
VEAFLASGQALQDFARIYLAVKGRDELSIQLVTLLTGIITACFGGYGFAAIRREAEEEEAGL